jgi:hypothetical protein
MDVSLRVAERYQLAIRVAERTKRGDSIGDPKELLLLFRIGVAKYAEKEADAKEYLRLHAEIVKTREELKPEAGHEAYKAVRERIEQLQAQRDGRDPSSRQWSDKGAAISIHMQQHGFDRLKDTARLLCLAILQQMVLSPKLRKSIEVASKFWARNIRLPRGKTVEDMYVERTELYLEHLELFRKHEKLFMEALTSGKSHSDTGDVVTRFKAGPFVVVNTGGFDTKLMEEKARLCEEAALKMEGIGLGKVCYGDVLITNRLSGERIAAFYLPSKDEMFVRADAKMTTDTVRVVCHELTHRLCEKFLSSKKSEIVKIYNTISVHSKVSGPSFKDYPERGDTLLYKGVELKVTDRDFRRKSVKLQDPTPRPDGRISVYTMPVTTFFELKGTPLASTGFLDFITSYAKRGGPEENFAEMVSFYAIGKLPKEQMDLLLPVLG